MSTLDIIILLSKRISSSLLRIKQQRRSYVQVTLVHIMIMSQKYTRMYIVYNVCTYVCMYMWPTLVLGLRDYSIFRCPKTSYILWKNCCWIASLYKIVWYGLFWKYMYVCMRTWNMELWMDDAPFVRPRLCKWMGFFSLVLALWWGLGD